mmetsp:Transcript_9022/g.9070  ORF Transcript_9022/g.9070 Transcript_9022/m.9070 type:complete len:215 (-) Transcript_9022:448-1092(-)
MSYSFSPIFTVTWKVTGSDTLIESLCCSAPVEVVVVAVVAEVSCFNPSDTLSSCLSLSLSLTPVWPCNTLYRYSETLFTHPGIASAVIPMAVACWEQNVEAMAAGETVLGLNRISYLIPPSPPIWRGTNTSFAVSADETASPSFGGSDTKSSALVISALDFLRFSTVVFKYWETGVTHTSLIVESETPKTDAFSRQNDVAAFMIDASSVWKFTS